MGERSCGGAANAAEVVERRRVMLWPSDLSSNSNLCSPRERIRGLPFEALEVDITPKTLVALQQIEAAIGKAIAGGRDRALCPTLVHLDVCRCGVGAVKEWR